MKFQIPNYKSQINSKLQFPNDRDIPHPPPIEERVKVRGASFEFWSFLPAGRQGSLFVIWCLGFGDLRLEGSIGENFPIQEII